MTTWNHPQIGQLYVSFMGFFNMVFAFTGTVVFVIALTTIQHTVAMNVADRTREIGMLRAMGFSRGKIAGLFVRESVLTTLIAACVALGLAYMTIYAILSANLQTQLPRIAEPVKLALDLPLGWALAASAVAALGIALGAAITARKRIGGEVRAKGKSVPLTRLLATTSCLMLATMLTVSLAHAEDAPSEATMRDWLRKADLARGGWGAYKWSLSIHTEDPAGATTTTYDIAVRDGRRWRARWSPRYQGEKILIASRAMWYAARLAQAGQHQPAAAAGGRGRQRRHRRHPVRPRLHPGLCRQRSGQRRGLPSSLVAATPGATYESIVYYLDKRSLMGVKADFLTAGGGVQERLRVRQQGQGQRPRAALRVQHEDRQRQLPDRYSRLQYGQVAPSNPPDSLFALDTLMTMREAAR